MNGYKVGDVVKANRQVTERDLDYMYIMHDDDTLEKINTQCHKVLDTQYADIRLIIDDDIAFWFPADWFVKVEEIETEYTIESLIEPLRQIADTVQQLSEQMNQISEIMNELKKSKEESK